MKSIRHCVLLELLNAIALKAVSVAITYNYHSQEMEVVIKTVATGIACGCSNYYIRGRNKVSVLPLVLIHGTA